MTHAAHRYGARANRRFTLPPKFLDRECSSLLIVNSVLTVPRDNCHNLRFWLVVESPPMFSLFHSRGKRRESVSAAEDRCVATSYTESISLSRKTLNELGRSLARHEKERSNSWEDSSNALEFANSCTLSIATWFFFDERSQFWGDCYFWKLDAC